MFTYFIISSSVLIDYFAKSYVFNRKKIIIIECIKSVINIFSSSRREFYIPTFEFEQCIIKKSNVYGITFKHLYGWFNIYLIQTNGMLTFTN